jgi:hypothetical protein
MDLLSWIWEGFVSGVMKVAGLWWLVLLFIAIQLLKDSGWLAKASRWMSPLLRPLRLPDEAGLPMIAGLAIGLTYGAGVILQTAEEGSLNREQLTVMCVFLGICHAVFEETILFTAAGSNGLLLVAIRFVTAVAFGYGLARIRLTAPVRVASGMQKGA